MKSSTSRSKDYTEARERLPRSQRLKAVEHTIDSAQNVLAEKPSHAGKGKPGPPAIALGDLRRATSDDPDELLKHRYLCRGGGMLLVGPSGIGKSSFVMQLSISFAIGLASFGIFPARPLRILIIQAENDDGDMAEMRDGVLAGLQLSPAQQEAACDNVIICRDDEHAGESFFLETVIPLLEAIKPDLLIIDPAHAYHGGDSSAQSDVGKFLRQLLNPIIRKHNCGVIIVHHTNKPPTGREKSTWSGSDFAYLGSGSAEWTNWSRAVLAIRQHSEGNFQLIAAKRGGRLRWKESDGESSTICKFIRHHSAPGTICWEEVPSEEHPATPPKPKTTRATTSEDLLRLLSPSKCYRKDTIIELARKQGISRDSCRGMISILIDNNELYEHVTPRQGTRPEVFYAQFKPPTSGDETL